LRAAKTKPIPFCQQLGDDIHEMICDQNDDAENYRGLDSTRDTEAEVETALRFFPNLIRRRKEVVWDDFEDDWIDTVDEGEYPIECLLYTLGNNGCHRNLKAIPFIHLFARLAVDFRLMSMKEEGCYVMVDLIFYSVLLTVLNHWMTKSIINILTMYV